MYLWVRLDNRLSPSSVRLLGVSPEEFVLLVAFGSLLLLLSFLLRDGCFRACSGLLRQGNGGGRD